MVLLGQKKNALAYMVRPLAKALSKDGVDGLNDLMKPDVARIRDAFGVIGQVLTKSMADLMVKWCVGRRLEVGVVVCMGMMV